MSYTSSIKNDNNNGYIAKITTSFCEIPGEICSSIYLSGCTFNCSGCQNPDLQNPSYGKNMSVDEVLKEINDNTLTKWVCFLGGEPFYQKNFLLELCKKIKKPIGIYTGYDFTKITQLFSDVIDIKNILFLKTGKFEIENIVENEYPITKNQIVYVKNNLLWEKCYGRSIDCVSVNLKKNMFT